MTTHSKILSKDFLIDVLTPFLPYIGEKQVVTGIKIKEDGKFVVLEYKVENELEVKLIEHT